MTGTTHRVFGFDSWTGGAFNFARLLPAFDERGMTLTILHIGSWGSDPNRPNLEKIGALEFRDVSFYAGKSFDEILDFERPDAIVLLSTQTFAHRAFLRYCKQRSIPTLHLYHGVVSVQVTDDDQGSHRISTLAYAKWVVPRLGKLIRRTFPCYMAALLRTGAAPREWWRFLTDIIRMARGLPALTAAEDASTSQGAVYTKADIEHAVRVYGFRSDDVTAVGNPDLVRFGFRADMLGAHNTPATLTRDRVMYIDTALATMGLQFKSQESFIEHLIATAKSLAAQGKKMIFKPHPANDLAFLRKGLDGAGIELIDKDEFMPQLRDCCACIAEATSLALVPALMGLPMLYATYGELSDQRFGPVLTSYPRGHLLTDVSRLSDILALDAERLDRGAVTRWIEANSGPLPAEDMPRRVADIVESMIARPV